jgi:hypothetical protein
MILPLTPRSDDDVEALEKRIRNLKGGRIGDEPLTDAELLARVQAVRGGPPPLAAPSGGWLPPQALSDAEAADELLRQAADAVRIDGGPAKSEDEARRIESIASHGGVDAAHAGALTKAELLAVGKDAAQTLREARGVMGTHSTFEMRGSGDEAYSTEEEEQAEAERLLAQLEDELVLEGGHGSDAPAEHPSQWASSEPAASSVPVFPSAPCANCDNDPFCARCWKEGHAMDGDLRHHRKVPIGGRQPLR